MTMYILFGNKNIPIFKKIRLTYAHLNNFENLIILIGNNNAHFIFRKPNIYLNNYIP